MVEVGVSGERIVSEELRDKFLELHIHLFLKLRAFTDKIEFTHNCTVTPLWSDAIEGLEDVKSISVIEAFRTASKETIAFDIDNLRIEATIFAFEYASLFDDYDDVVSFLSPLISSHSESLG